MYGSDGHESCRLWHLLGLPQLTSLKEGNVRTICRQAFGLTHVHFAGIAGVANDDVSRVSHSNVQVSYPAYPTLQPITSNPPASSYNQYLPAPAQQEHSYDSMQGHGSQSGQGMQSYYQQPQAQPQSQAVPQQQQQPYQDMYSSQGANAYTQQLSHAPANYQVGLPLCVCVCHAHLGVSVAQARQCFGQESCLCINVHTL